MTNKTPKTRSDFSEPDSPWKPLGARQEDRDVKKQAVLRAASRLFLERGWNRATLQELADRLNITKPALYNYFSSKEDILRHCLPLNEEMTLAAFDKAEAHSGTGRERLRVFLELYAAINMSERGAFPNRLDDRELQDELRQELRAIKRRIDRRARALVEAGIADGSITPCDVRLTTFAFMGAIQSISRWYRPDGPQASEEIAREFATRIICGLLPSEIRDRTNA
jgi:AcrR family transcriptional regulator